MKYAALDFETGNASPLSACSLGVSLFEDHALVRREVVLIRPPAEVGKFHWGNIRVHGIRERMVADAPSFAEVWNAFSKELANSLIVCHNAVFDTGVLCACLAYYGLRIPDCRYLCTVKVAQRVWPELDNHKLNTVCAALGIPLNHHEAGSDAYAAGRILLEALHRTGCADADALAQHIGMQLGRMSAEGRMACSIAKNRSAAACAKQQKTV